MEKNQIPRSSSEDDNEIIPLVDKYNQHIGFKKRSELGPDDIYRSVSLWVTDREGKHLLAKRSAQKKHRPGLWSSAVTGTLGTDEYQVIETGTEAIRREAKEEINLDIQGVELQLGPLWKIDTSQNKCFKQRYMLEYFGSKDLLHPRVGEVDELIWVTTEELQELLHTTPQYFSESVPRIAQELQDTLTPSSPPYLPQKSSLAHKKRIKQWRNSFLKKYLLRRGY